MTTLETLLELAKTEEGRMRIRVMVAELDGYERRPDGQWRRAGMIGSCGIPNYTGSLDAMVEAERSLTGEGLYWPLYRQILFEVAAGHNWRDYLNRVAPSFPKGTTRGQAYVLASPLHRAIAFILAKQPEHTNRTSNTASA